MEEYKNIWAVKEKEILLNSFVYSNFNYCPLVWHFCSSESLNKIEKIQEREHRLLHNDFSSDYSELLNKSGKPSMEVKRLRTLALEIFKTLNNLNPGYMKEIFFKTANLTRRPFDIKVNQNSSTKHGQKSLKSLGPHIWNSPLIGIKEETNYEKLKNYINEWFGVKCKCRMCSFLNP